MRIDNEHWREKLHELQISQSETASMSQKSASYAPELNMLEKKLVEQRKQAEQAKQVAKKVQLVDDQVQSWCSRVIQKLDQQFGENIGHI